MQRFQKITLLHAFPIALHACILALICLTSVSYASSPPADSVHVCLPFDYEQWRRDHPRPAAKRLANLNVGEPRTVRMIYFLPNDRAFRQEVVDSMKVTIRQIQTFYADQMAARGYGRKTFRFETDAQGEPIVHRVDGQHPESHYLSGAYPDPIDESYKSFNRLTNILFVVLGNSTRGIGRGAGGVGQNIGKNGGHALVSEKFHWKLAAHELGHAFGLEHDFRDGDYIMSYGSGRDRLSACHAEYLSVHPYFNPDSPIAETPPPTIELISPQAYPTGSKSVSIQLRVSDPDGLHQVLFFAANESNLKACRGLTGSTEAIVEFDYDGNIPSPNDPDGANTSLSNPLVHSIYVRAVDTGGDVGVTSFKLLDISALRNLIATLEGHTQAVNSVVFSPDGTTLASGAFDGKVVLWDVATRTNIATLGGHTGTVFSPDGTTLASGSGDGTVVLWDVATRTNIATLRGHTQAVNSVVFSPDGTTLASGSWDNTVVLWDVATRTNIATLRGHTSIVNSVVFSPDGTTLASGSGDGTVVLWDVATRTNIATLRHMRWVNSVVFSPDGTTLASGAGYGKVVLWDVATRTNIATLEGHTGTRWVRSVVFSPDGTTLASGSGDGTVVLWDVATRTNIATLEGYASGVNSVVFSPDGTTLASGTGDGTILLWDMSPYITPQTPASAPTPDFNGDGFVNIVDFVLFANQFGLSRGDVGYDARYDLDGDGNIGIGDFVLFAAAFGQEGA